MSISEDKHISRLSAVFDDEASIEDLDALLQESPDELNQQLQSYQLIRQTLHRDSVWQGEPLNLAAQIRDRLDKEEDYAANVLPLSAKSVPSQAVVWRGWFSGLAVAASVAFVVILGGNHLINPEAEVNTTAQVETPQEQQPVSEVVAIAELTDKPLPADSLRLKNYLREHAEQAAKTAGQGMIPMARVVSYPIEEK
ncbi:RseA family anti-sigma factor [Marinomonas sp.]